MSTTGEYSMLYVRPLESYTWNGDENIYGLGLESDDLWVEQ